MTLADSLHPASLLAPLPLHRALQAYDWGSKTLLAELRGREPSGGFEAEYWYGDHPNGPAQVQVDGRWIPLPAVIEAFPTEILGQGSGSGLPFLLKLLAAGQPLSIQAHPDLERAQQGFDEEERLGVPITAPNRNYRDRNHKPELIYALTPFRAMYGFRELPQIAELVSRLAAPGLHELAAPFRAAPGPSTLQSFFLRLLEAREDEGRARQLFLEIVAATESASQAASDDDDRRGFEWTLELARAYPDDPTVVSPLLLNPIEIQPGEALFTEAGVLHSYVSGLGVEIMATSDNVLRGGLTTKHVDPGELAEVVHYGPTEVAAFPAAPGSLANSHRYRPPVQDFELEIFELADESEPLRAGGPSILLGLEGVVQVMTPSGGVTLKPTDAALLPAGLEFSLASGETSDEGPSRAALAGPGHQATGSDVS